MKTLLFFIFLTVFQLSFSQSLQKSYTPLGGNAIDENVPSPIISYKEKIKEKKGYLFNQNMLDIFFSEKIGTAFGGSNDISLQKYFASLNSTDESFTIGFNFDNRFGNSLEQLDLVFSGGFKFNSKEGFSNIRNSADGFKGSKIGAVLKLSIIGNGIISYADKRKNGKVVVERDEVIKKYRQKVYDKIEKKVDSFNKNEFANYAQLLEEMSGLEHQISPLKKVLDKKSKGLYKEIADEEIKFLKENKLYRWMGTYWFSLDGFVPFGRKEYNVTPIVDNEATKKELYNFSLSLSGNGFIEWSGGQSLFLKILYKVERTNNIILDELSTTAFQSGSINIDNTVNITPVVSAYDTVYDDFLRESITIEPAIFLFKNTIGFSPSVEFNLTEKYNATNWKLGIPISLKDKEGKPKVNFEVQWKQISTLSKVNHIVGVTTSFLFGDLIN